MKIKYLPIDESKAQWANKDSLMRYFEGLNRSTLSHWLVEMRDDPEFSSFVINPTHKLVFVNIEGFLKFLRKKQSKSF